MSALIRSPTVRWALLLVLACVLCWVPYGESVGEKTEIPNPSVNYELRDLAQFAVDERNRMLREGGFFSRPPVAFVNVLAAQKQVVSSGTKYYLKIATTKNEARESEIYDSVVLVKPTSKELHIFNLAQ